MIKKCYRQIKINCDNVLFINTIRNNFVSVSNVREVRLIHGWCKKN